MLYPAKHGKVNFSLLQYAESDIKLVNYDFIHGFRDSGLYELIDRREAPISRAYDCVSDKCIGELSGNASYGIIDV